MLRAADLDRFLEGDGPRWVLGHGYLAWCWSSSLRGVAVFGTPDPEDAAALVRLCQQGAPHPGPIDVVLDGRYLEALTAEVFDPIATVVRRRLPELELGIRRCAVLASNHPASAAIIGLLVLGKARHDWRVFQETGEAFGWLQASAAAAPVDALIAQMVSVPEVVRQVRELLAGDPRASLGQIASALARSPRTLQRELSRAGASFGAERARQRANRGNPGS